MRWLIVLLVFGLFFLNTTIAQKTPTFQVEVSQDSILFGNYFIVKFILENAQGQDFQAPDFSDFYIVGGPNISSSTSIVNGDIAQKSSYTFYLEPKDVGNFYIQAASIRVGTQILETAPLAVLVVPNPDGIKQNTEQKESFDVLKNRRDLLQQTPQKEVKPHQKKKKTYRI